MASVLSKYVVLLEAQSAKYQRELEGAQKKLVRFERQNKKSLDLLEKRFSRMGSGIRSAFGGLAAGFSFAAVIRETVKAQNELAQLDAVLKSTGGRAGLTRTQLIAMAQDFSAATTHSTGDITNAQTRLLSYSAILANEFPRALQIAIDQSARLGMGLEQSAEIIGRAIETPSRGVASLTRQGFAFTEAQREMLKALEETGRRAEAQAIVLGVLEESYGGAAAAARNTFGGALQSLKNSFTDLLSARGGLTEATQKLNEASALLQDPATVQAIERYTSAMITGFSTAVGWLSKLSGLMQEIGEGFARFVGAGTPIDEAADRIANLQRMIDSLHRSRGGKVPTGSSLDLVVKRLQAEQVELQKLVDLNKELMRGRAANQEWHPPMALPPLPAISVPVGLSEKDQKALDAFLKLFETAEHKAQALRATLAKFKGELKPGEFERIGKEISDSLHAGLETIEITAKKINPLLADMQRYNQLIQQNRTPREELNRQIESALLLRERLIAAGKEEALVNETIGRELRRLGDEYEAKDEAAKKVADTARDVGLTFTSAFEDAIVEGNKLSDVLRGLYKDLLRLAVRKLITEPFLDFFGGLFKPQGKASGGPVTGGTPYVVGEQGPELFVPRSSGHIVPNGAGGAVIQQTFNVQVGLPPQWQAQLAAVTQLAASKARQDVEKSFGGRR